MSDPLTPDIASPEPRDNSLEIELADGTRITVQDILDDLDADEALETVIDLCATKGGPADG